MQFLLIKVKKKSKLIFLLTLIVTLLSINNIFLLNYYSNFAKKISFHDKSNLGDIESMESKFNKLSTSKLNTTPAWGPISVGDYPIDDNWIGDINNDSLNDIVVPTHLDSVANVYYQGSDNSWPSAHNHTLDIGFNGYSVDFGDLNDDGLTDIISRAQDNIRIYFQYEDGSGISSTYNSSLSYN